MTDLIKLQQRLTEAEEAYHQLMMGVREVSVNIGGYGSVTYNQTSIERLESYISKLKTDIKRIKTGSGRKAIFVEF